VFDVNYLLFSVFLTTFVVILLQLLGSPAVPTAEARLLDTAIGSGLALLAYLAWPTWEGLGAQTKFAQLIEAHRDYAVGLLRLLAGSGDADLPRLRGLQVAARRARSDAEASTARLAAEPPHPPLTPTAARAVMAPVTRLAHAELALHALASSAEVASEQELRERKAPERRLEALAAGTDAAMTAIATALSTLRRPPTSPALRPMEAALREPPPLDPQTRVAVDGLVDAVDTIDATVRDRVLADSPR
jgi:uncharacterized membrane protein YccC